MKTKNMKLRSSRIKEILTDQPESKTSVLNSLKCDYSNCEKGPDLKVMTPDEFPIDSATFTKINNFLYKIQYIFNSKINNQFKIFGPFLPSIISNINNYELRQYPISTAPCKCNSLYSLRNKNLENNGGFKLGLEKLIYNSSGGEFVTQSEINLPMSFIVFNQQGYYRYLNVDKDSIVSFSSIPPT